MKNLLLVIIFIALVIGGLFAGNTYILPLLQPSVGRLTVKATAESEVLLDNTLLGKTPFYADNLRIGDHTLTIKKSADFSWDLDTSLTRSTQTVINVDLANSQTFSAGENLYFRTGDKGLAIVTYPEGSLVSIDGKDAFKAPFDKELETGVHTLSVKKEGYITREVTINIEDGYKLNGALYLAANPFEKTTKIDSNSKASLFQVFNSKIDLSKNPSNWADGVQHIQEGFDGGETRFDGAIDQTGKLYIFNQTEWDNKKLAKSVINLAYLNPKDSAALTNEAKNAWEKVKADFN